MALTAFTGTIDPSTLNSNFDDKTSALTTQMQAGQKDFNVSVRFDSLASTAELRDRSIAFVAPDHGQIRVLWVRATDTGSRALTVSLEVENGDNDYLVEHPVTLTLTTSVGTDGDYLDLRTGTPWLRVIKGVRYRLIFAAGSGTVSGPIYGGVQIRTRRRDA